MVICSSEMSSYETCQKDQSQESGVDACTCGGVGVHGDQLTGGARFTHAGPVTRQGWRGNRLLPACAGVRKPR